jgi:predicted RNase H-like HicB family nuclease
MKIKVIFHKAEEGGYWAEVPALPGCFSQGETIEETKLNIREAIEGFLEIEEKSIEIGLEDEIHELAI